MSEQHYELAPAPDKTHPLWKSFELWRKEVSNYVDDEALMWQCFLSGFNLATHMVNQVLQSQYGMVLTNHQFFAGMKPRTEEVPCQDSSPPANSQS